MTKRVEPTFHHAYPGVTGWALIARAEDIGVTWCYFRRDAEREVWWSADEVVAMGAALALKTRWGEDIEHAPGSLLDRATQAILDASGGMARPSWARHLAAQVLAVVEADRVGGGAELD